MRKLNFNFHTLWCLKRFYENLKGLKIFRLKLLFHLRESTRTLLHENEKLQTQVAQTEKDTIDVISFLKHEDEKKNAQVEFVKIFFLKVFLLNAFLIVMF